MTYFKSLLTAAAATTLAVGCVKTDAPSEVSRAIPTSDQVAIKLPAGQNRDVGQLADYYVTTRGVTATLNGGSAWVLILLHAIVEQPPTSVSGDVYTWGPGSQALDPADYRLDVTANADGTYDYVLSGQSKVAPAGFLPLISGHADPTPGDDLGNGNFDMAFDNMHTVDPIDNPNARGDVKVDYDLAAHHLGLTLTSVDINGSPVTASYAYDEDATGGGDMTFDVDANIGGTAALEEMTMRSRWLATGEGRGDARITGGDIGTDLVIASECWSSMFIETFYTDNQNFQPTAGDPTSCAFADQDLPPAQ
jgi:hypothetical protein